MGIEVIKYRNIDAIKLSFNPYNIIILNGRGCNVIEFIDTSKNLSFLHFPEDNELDEFIASPQRFGNAILFHPNKISHGRFTKNNITYNFSEYGIPWSHGIIKELPFELINSAENSESIFIKFRFNSLDTPYYTGAGWNFTLDFEFTLSSEGLTQNIIFHNNGTNPIPFGLGFHTAFRIPFDHSNPDQYKVFATCGKRWENDEYGYPSGKLVSLENDYLTKGVSPLTHSIAEHTTAISANLASVDEILTNFHGAVVCDTITGTKFIYETDPLFTHWMMWNNNASDNYICIEPMTWMINAPNVPIPDSESGFQFINPDQVWQAKNRLYVRF